MPATGTTDDPRPETTRLATRTAVESAAAAVDSPAVDEDLSPVRPQDTAEEVDERALAGAIFAEQSMDGARTQFQVHAVQGSDAGKVLGNTLQTNKRIDAGLRTVYHAHLADTDQPGMRDGF